ncbi:RdRP-domain-containing protein [Daedaleopsis nitida]|nr:RdRP-domain-containing protein [Daedaleopsis nitida]
MEIHLSRVAFGTDVHRLKMELANILHRPPFLPSTDNPFNFEVSLFPQKRPGPWRSASLTLPSVDIGNTFLQWYGGKNARCQLILGAIRVSFDQSHKPPRRETLERVRRMPYEDPRVAQAREQQTTEFRATLVQLKTVQFGWECRDHVYSIEWERKDYSILRFDGDRREFRVQVPGLDDTRTIAIRVSQVSWISASPPPNFESESSVASMAATLGGQTDIPQRQRWSAFDETHEAVAPYTSLAIRLECASLDDLNIFRNLARVAHVQVGNFSYPIERRGLFSEALRERYDLWVRGLPWTVAFHIEALLRSWLADVSEVLSLREPIDRVLRRYKREYTAALLRDFITQAKTLFWYGTDQFHPEHASQHQPKYTANTVSGLFAQVRDQFVYKPLETPLLTGDVTAPFHCLHLIGPYPERSNRDCFLRYRFDRDVDGRSFIDRRVKRILLDGITIAGAHFTFLAYSQSALKEHSVWFVKPFRHVDERGNTQIVDATSIIASLGNFRNLSFDPTLIHCPARYAARISQAFTATDASISMEVGQIMQGRDIMDATGKYAFTDGVGTISLQLAMEIWRALREKRRRGRQNKTYPRAYQIRFQGSKGMLSIDYTLPGRSILLRPSMIKFEAPRSLMIEIARAFDKPEGLGALQDNAVREAQRSISSLELSARLLEIHGLGASFRLTSSFLGLHKLGMMAFAVNHVLRELKHHARIPVPGDESWTLVGVADVHGYLNEGEVFVCVDSQYESSLIYLEGDILVSRSPTIHPGDVQVVRAIESLRNTIVFSILGQRPLPSCLGGGDLDGDVYNVTTRRDLLPRKRYRPASYEPAPKKLVEHESTMKDVAEFVAEYINSDTLGIIATTWLTIADQSSEGILHPDCLKLAALHSDAVDYPKSGHPVPSQLIPRPPFKVKPDWSAPETISKDSTRYYESQRAIGKLFRAIDLPAVAMVERVVRLQRRHLPDAKHDERVADMLNHFHAEAPSVDDDVVYAVQERVADFIATDDYDDETIISIWELYNTYVSQLRAICADHTLSHTRSAMLTEEEAVVGTIVAKCSQPRKRKDTMSQMREQTATLVGSVKGEISGDEDIVSEESLRRTWIAYRLAGLEGDIFGARSFGWIALGGIFDAIKEIEDEQRTQTRRAIRIYIAVT